MARTLIIKNADFSVNKVTTVDIEEDVPCTGITLNKSTSTISHLGDTDTLTATVVPSNTTDSIIWSTNDPDVVTVAGGVVTAIGCGTAEITATCGNASATCTVTVEHIATLTTALNMYIGKGINDYLNGGDLENYGLGYSGNGTLYLYALNSPGKYPYPIPNGANKISIETDDLCPYGFWLSYTEHCATSSNVAKAFEKDDFGNALTTAGNRTVNIPDRTTGTYVGVNAVGFCFRCRTGTISQQMLDDVVVRFTA